MQSIKRLNLFIRHYTEQLKRKWKLLPLILLFPIILIGTVIILTVLFIYPDENEYIQIGIVDQDGSVETESIISLLEENNQLGSLITIESMTETVAAGRLANDDLSAYITFPAQFTNDLYKGNPVTLHIVGNEYRETESYLIKELIDSLMRHIRTSQATILMINKHAKKIGMKDDERRDLIFEQFTSSFINVLGKDKVISEHTITNRALTSTVHYYVISIVFILSLVWSIIIYNILYRKETNELRTRLNLYGVTQYVQICAKLIVTLILTAFFTICVMAMTQYFLSFNLYLEDIVRIGVLFTLNSLIYLQVLALSDIIISSERIRLTSQLFVTFSLIFLSGTLVPTVYLPLSIQAYLRYLPTYESLFWLQEILLNDRLYANFNLLLIYVICGFILLSGISFIKERVTR